MPRKSAATKAVAATKASAQAKAPTQAKGIRVIAARSGKTIYRDGDTVLKVFDGEYSKSGILNEALNQARVEESGLAIPKLLEVCKVDGKWAIRREYVAGKSLQELMEKNPDKMVDYLELFVKTQREIFSRRVRRLNSLVEKLDRQIAASLLSATARYDLHTRLTSLPQGDAICHGDFNPSNIIIDAKGVPHLIDWSHVTQGDPAADAARTYLLFCLEGKEDLANKYLDLFVERSGITKQLIQQWMPIVAAAQSTKGKEEERELLLRWADVVDYV